MNAQVAPGLESYSALDLARALLARFPGLTHGELVVQVQATDVKVLRMGRTFLPDELADMRLEGAPAG